MLEEKIKKTLEKERNILFAYIFGSYARGEARENSDIDLAIYVKRIPKDIFKYESKIASKIEKEIKKFLEKISYGMMVKNLVLKMLFSQSSLSRILNIKVLLGLIGKE